MIYKNRPRFLSVLLLFTITLLLISFASPVLANAQKHNEFPPQPKQRSILVLFPLHQGIPAYSLALTTLQTELEQADDFELEIYCEYFDMGRFPQSEIQQDYLDLLAEKYTDQNIDLVIITGNALLSLWLEHGEEIFPDVPIVFYDIVPDSLENLELPPNVTGITAPVDYLPSVQWYLETYPAINEVVLVHGVGTTDLYFSISTDKLQSEMAGKVQFTDLSELSVSDIKARLSELPPTAVVVFSLFFEDTEGNQYVPLEILPEIAAASAVPVLCGYDQFIGTGVIGGYLYSIEEQAIAASSISLRILRGEAAADIPILSDQTNRFIFDHQALMRYRIPLSALPPDSLLKNRQYSTWELYRTEILIGVFFVLILIVMVIYLFLLSRKLNESRQKLAVLNTGLEAEVKRQTTLLRDQKEHYHSIFDSTRDAILIEELDGSILDANLAACEMYDFSLETLQQKKVHDLLAPHSLNIHHARLEKKERISEYLFEAIHQRADGSQFPVEVSCCDYLLRGKNRRVCTIRDIKERKEMEMRLRNAQRLSSLGSLSGGLAHEINSPLQVITGISGRLLNNFEKQTSDPVMLKQDLEKIDRHAWRIARLIEILHHYAYPSIGQAKHFHMENGIREVLEQLDPVIQKNQIQVTLDAPSEIPDLLCNTEGITQMIFQLLKNALDAMPEGGELVVRLQHDQQINHIILQVSDNGKGIPDNIRERIFDPFFTTKPLEKGDGVGLSVVQTIVSAHNGDIQVQSQPGQGTTITVYFPLSGISSAVDPPESFGRYDPEGC